jgi:hypothetical protein
MSRRRRPLSSIIEISLDHVLPKRRLGVKGDCCPKMHRLGLAWDWGSILRVRTPCLPMQGRKHLATAAEADLGVIHLLASRVRDQRLQHRHMTPHTLASSVNALLAASTKGMTMRISPCEKPGRGDNSHEDWGGGIPSKSMSESSQFGQGTGWKSCTRT